MKCLRGYFNRVHYPFSNTVLFFSFGGTMTFLLLKRVHLLRPLTNCLLYSQIIKFSTSKSSPFPCHGAINNRLRLSPLFSGISESYDMKDCKIEVVDDDTWRVSSGLAEAWRESNEKKTLQTRHGLRDHGLDGIDDYGVIDSTYSNTNGPDFDEIEDMRIHGKLFYKVDKDSREYQEYKFDFHRRKSTRNEKNKKEGRNNREREKIYKSDSPREPKKTKKESHKESSMGFDKETSLFYHPSNTGDSRLGKKQRTPTFNQMTAPYHEPFCLDIYISKGSVRACVVHRATSKVVSVSHSISKDMKFDLGSTKNRTACVAVGRVLAQRAIEDDIHNVVYTPRKGDKLEGKIGVVVKAIVDGGVDVKVKLKKKKLGWARGIRSGTKGRHSFE